MTDHLSQPVTSAAIAYCPEHGLHGERQECFVCGGPVEQIEMVPSALAADVVAAWDATAGPEQREWFPWLYDAIQKLRKALPTGSVG